MSERGLDRYHPTMRKIDVEKWRKYFDARNEGRSVAESCRISRISESAAYRFEQQDGAAEGLEAAELLGIEAVNGIAIRKPLCPEAKLALEDFAYFRLRYFGRTSTPWQLLAVQRIIELLETPDKERAVVNMPPGTGKSTLFTHDLICWLICRDRSIRVLIGSTTAGMAKLYVGSIKTTLERFEPIIPTKKDLREGMIAPEASLAKDYGAFKPEGRSEKWSKEGIVVRQLDGSPTDDKEDTVFGMGLDSEIIGVRVDFAIFDDLVTPDNMASEEGRERVQFKWNSVFERRIDDTGLLVLQGQRIRSNDLYRYVLDKKNDDETPEYHHIVFKSHYDHLCEGKHEKTSPAYPDPGGCLLDPRRASWREISAIRFNEPRVFETVYQQEDGEASGTLAKKVWIFGGVDDEDWPAIGCIDKNREIRGVPMELRLKNTLDPFSFITIDPSPSNWWGIIWWLYNPVDENRYIIDICRKKMRQDQFHWYDMDRPGDGLKAYSGLIPEWVTASREPDIDIPITDIICETNAAQKWLIGQPHVIKWMRLTNVTIHPHDTGRNKIDPKMGVNTLAPLFKQGKIRIPYGDATAREKVKMLISEVTRYPESDTADLVMSTWFHKICIEKFYVKRTREPYRLPGVPNWYRGTGRGLINANG